MGTFHIWTIGCQMNTADARKMTEELQHYGYEAAEDFEAADLAVLYSCMVRQHAEDKVHSQLGELRLLKQSRPSLRVALAGCIGDVSWWQRKDPFVDFFLSPGQDMTVRDKLVDLLDLQEYYRHEPASAARTPRVSEGITMHQGCNRSCTFCIVPSTRGRERSRLPFELVEEARALVERGTREIVLLSQIAERYGRDLRPRVSLATLLGQISRVEQLERIRFLTSYPGDFTDDIIEAVATLPKVCEDINLPVQSGDDEMLRAMRRGYSVGFYKDLVARIRARVPDVALQTDIIVGFPGETEAQFDNTLKVLAEIEFDIVHVAAYSPRPGTPAATSGGQLPLDEKRRRIQRVEALQKRIATEKNARYLGRIVEVLVEGEARGKWYGRTRTNKLVHFAHPGSLGGEMVLARISSTSPWSLQGEPVEIRAAVPA
ncbi:MAG: tRNA (N6-isopentenyl adenosine(37)-C2)-methylthiotransferase MiaB [Chloroflexi bacterium]|nr:tRNA (N6-isopentenyl adenosine(37)-C2)-methylthiotransferase MiaB [Chloroflexota bacterium]